MTRERILGILLKYKGCLNINSSILILIAFLALILGATFFDLGIVTETLVEPYAANNILLFIREALLQLISYLCSKLYKSNYKAQKINTYIKLGIYLIIVSLVVMNIGTYFNSFKELARILFEPYIAVEFALAILRIFFRCSIRFLWKL